jgi:hypothetical protein
VSKSSVLIGFSVSPTHISAVRLSAADFSVEMQAHRQLPPATITHDGKKLLDSPTLVPLIREMMVQIGNPEFSDPVYLCLYTPLMATHSFQMSQIQSLRKELSSQLIHQGQIRDELPLLQYSLLWQQGETALVTYGAFGSELIKEYCNVFYEAGLKIKSLDVLPFCVLRGLAASGVLDALLHKIGTNSVWGCFGITGSQTWYTLWHSTNLLFMGNFTTPTDQKSWEERLLEIVSEIGIDSPVVWLAWYENGMPPPIDPLHLKLKAPIRPANLGPFYGYPPHQPSTPAIGAALKSEILFPLGWDYLSDPITESIKGEYVTTPYTNYQPVLPKLFLMATSFLLLAVLLASGYFGIQNYLADQAMATQKSRTLADLKEISAGNQLYMHLFSWIHQKTMEGIQIESLKIAPETLLLAGKSNDKALIDQFITLLTASEAQNPASIKKVDLKTEPLTEPAGTFHFDFSGKIQQAGASVAPKPKKNGSKVKL